MIKTEAEVFEAMFRGLLYSGACPGVRTGGMGGSENLPNILLGLHNACTHTDFKRSIDAGPDDRELKALIGGLEKALKAARKIEEQS